MAGVILTPLAIAFCLLQVGDAVTTYLFMSDRGDGLTEGNKFAAKLMDRIGLVPALVAIKLPPCALVLFLPLHDYLLWAGIALYVVVVGRNVKLMRG